MSLVKNFLIQLWETKKENRTRKSIEEKPLELDEKMWKEKQKIINIVDGKTFQPGPKTRKKKPRFVMRRETWLK